MNAFSFGQYYPSSSFIHRLDARTKVLLAILWIVVTFLCKTVLAYLALLLLTVVMIALAKIPLGVMLRSVKPLLFIILFTVVINLFFGSGEELLTPADWKIRIYKESVENAVFMLLRIICLVIGSGLFLTYTTTPMQLTDALEFLLSPLKLFRVPVHVFAMMMSITLRFIPTLAEETEKIIRAQKARGTDFETGGLIKRIKALIPILIPLFISAVNRALELATAMECRLYHGGDGRTRLHTPKIGFGDVATVLVIAALCAGIVFCNTLPFTVI